MLFRSGIGYKYAHDYPNHYVHQQYLPTEIQGEHFYELSAVALDRACVDQVRASEDHGKIHLIERIDSRHGMHTLDYAEQIGLGSQQYELVELK